MSNFEVNSLGMKKVSAEYRKYKIKLDNIRKQVDSCNNKLRKTMDSSAYANVYQYLSSISSLIGYEVKRIDTIQTHIEELIDLYCLTEKEIKERKVIHQKIEINSRKNKVASNVLDKLSKGLKNYKGKDKEYIDLLADVVDLYSDGYGSDDNIEMMDALKDYISSQMGVGELNDLVNIVNLIDSGASLDEILESIGNQCTKVFEEYGGIAGGMAGVTASSFLITGIQMIMSDESVSGQDISDWLLGAGLSGMNKGISDKTKGFADFDVNKSLEIFRNRTSQVSQYIQDTGLPLWEQTGLAICATPFIAIWCIGETYVDYGYGIGNDVMSLINI